MLQSLQRITRYPAFGFSRRVISQMEMPASPASDSTELMTQYHLVPVAEHPIFPGSTASLTMSEEQYERLKDTNTVFASIVKNDLILKDQTDAVALMQAAIGLKTPPYRGLPQIASESDIYRIGTLCSAKAIHDKQNPYSPFVLNLFPLQKGMIINFIDPVAPLARVEITKSNDHSSLIEEDLKPHELVIFKFLKQQYLKCFKIAPDEKFLAYMQFLERNFDTKKVSEFIYMLLTCVSLPQYINTYSFLVNVNKHQLQEVYETQEIGSRLQKMNEIFTDFVNKIEIWQKLEQQYDFKSDQVKTQKKLEEIYESLKKHFTNEKDEKQETLKQFLKELEGKSVPDHIMKVINEEIQKFMQTEKQHSEMQVTRTYLEYLCKMPYGIRTDENYDLELAKQVLDSGHYGMDEVKQRILEFIAVGKLQNSVQGKILCFVGPPGVGKTSIGESIAKALGRKYVRIALGGVTDTSSLKGFRRTYVGAIPGKIVRALKTAEVENPVILIDEVDKIGQRSHQGDPGSALLEILDPEQNHSFTDDYLDVPIDLSKCLFLCTANILDSLHPAVLDRMEIIELAGYTHKEKRYIMDNYLVPQAIENAGLQNHVDQFAIPDPIRDFIISNYAREPGVRGLKRFTNRIMEKIAFKLVSNDALKVTLTEESLQDFIGPPIFGSKRIYQATPPGVVVGLAYNQYGGGILFIEATKANQSKVIENSRGSLRVTGSLGEVMKESSSIAQTFAKNFLFKNFSQSNPQAVQFLEQQDIHIHFPEGSVPKDGPSAGITITCSLVGLALGSPTIRNIGMTGEISLNGKVLKIGGVKEKTMAAAREGLKELIFPASNKADIERLPAYIKQDIKFHFVEDFQDVFRIVYPQFKMEDAKQ